MIPLIAAARRRDPYPLPAATETAPYGAISLCTIPTPDGVGATIHPSVVDMGQAWNGYRWWMANTPWPNSNDSLENPIIVASNDRVTWEVPDGLSNPIEPAPGTAGYYNSDTELVWDAENDRFVCFWRWVGGGLNNVRIRCRTSSDGIAWSEMIDLFEPPSYSASPTVIPRPGGGWYMIQANQWVCHQSDDLLGPWTPGPAMTGKPAQAYHGQAIRCADGGYLAIATSGSPLSMYATTSTDGLAWTQAVQVPANGLLPASYRPSLAESTKDGWIDVWHSGVDNTLPGRCGVAYTRLPRDSFTT